MTYIRNLLFDRILKDLPKHVDGSAGFDSDTRLHPMLMDEPNELLRRGLRVGFCGGRVRGCAVDGGFVVEAVEVAAGFLEVLDPSFGLEHSLLANAS